MTFDVVDGIADLPAADWDALVDADDPFTEHAFLATLEDSGSVGEGTGWLPCPVVVRDDDGRLCGAVPLYLKTDSYGEFVFDWGWASSAQRAGIRYYPKLVAAVPFTPVTGRRLLARPDADQDAVAAALQAGMRAVADEARASSIHVLFCTGGERERLAAAAAGGDGAYHARTGFQFHWSNRAPEPYRDFDDYLGAMTSRMRKQIRKERAGAAAHGLRFETIAGPDLGAREWKALRRFYVSTAAKHGGSDYLTGAFFDRARATLAHRLVSTLAFRGAEPVAGTVDFEKGRCVYGRYWGCDDELPFLHFELCYYRLIDRAIARGYTRFEAGAQGEHKLKRGLLPSFTHSAHWMRHPGLDAAVAAFCVEEAAAVRVRAAEYAAHSPFAAGRP